MQIPARPRDFLDLCSTLLTGHLHLLKSLGRNCLMTLMSHQCRLQIPSRLETRRNWQRWGKKKEMQLCRHKQQTGSGNHMWSSGIFMYITLFYSRIQNLELFINISVGTSKMASIHVRFFGILSHLKDSCSFVGFGNPLSFAKTPDERVTWVTLFYRLRGPAKCDFPPCTWF